MRQVVLGIPLLVIAIVGAALPIVGSIGVLRRGIDTGSVSWIVFGGACSALWLMLFRSVLTTRGKAARAALAAKSAGDSP